MQKQSTVIIIVGTRLLLLLFLLFLAQVPPFFLKYVRSYINLKYVNNVVFFWDLIVHALKFHIYTLVFDINWNEVHVLFNDFQRFVSTKKSDWWSFLCVYLCHACACVFQAFIYTKLYQKSSLINIKRHEFHKTYDWLVEKKTEKR